MWELEKERWNCMYSLSDEQYNRFSILLEQLQIPTEIREQYLQNSGIEKLVVNKGTKQWYFHLKVPAILPVSVYELLESKLISSFSHIANVSMMIQVGNQTVTPEDIQHYWPLVVKKIPIIPPIFHNMHQWKIHISGTKIEVNVRTDIEVTTFQNKCVASICDAYQSCGFPYFQFSVNSGQCIEDMKKFKERTDEEDRVRILQAIDEKEKREKEMESDTSGISGPLIIGYQIKDDDIMTMSSIIDEEKRKTIQGYVFHVETRELRSGRLLVTFKITDYTDSIMVKVFSRDKEDIVLLKSIQKGMWLKVRGAIQNDTFVRDLVMTANDINEVKPVERCDKEPDGEKRVELHLHTPMSQMDAVSSVSRLVAQAKKWGHEAIAVTDHGCAQSFPEAFGAGKKHDIKILY